MGVYNENRDNNNSMHDEIREQNKKMKGASFNEKLIYFKDYYLKATIIILIVLGIIANIIYTISKAPDETAFGALVFNCTTLSDDTALQDGFVESENLDTTKSEVFIDTSYIYSQNYDNSFQYESSYLGLQKAVALMQSKDVDVIMGNQEAFDYFVRSECFFNVNEFLPSEISEKYKDKIYYFEDEETGEKIPMGIYITDAPKITDNHYYDYSEAIIGFVLNSQHTERAIRFLEFLYEE